MFGIGLEYSRAGKRAICYDADYYPYGSELPITNTCPQNYKYERDPEKANDYATFRYYHTRFGRFMSADPLAGFPGGPQTLNISMPGLNGREPTRQILKDHPAAKVLVLTVHQSEQLAHEVLKAGARGYLPKSDAVQDLAVAVEALLGNKTFFTGGVAQFVLEDKSSTEVASALGASVKTAETHGANILRKLGFHSVSELVRDAIQNNIVRP